MSVSLFLQNGDALLKAEDFTSPDHPPSGNDSSNSFNSMLNNDLPIIKSEPLDDVTEFTVALPEISPELQTTEKEPPLEKPIHRTSLGRIYCDFCNYSTTLRGQMKKHAVKHIGDPRYNLYCPLCTFSTIYRTSFNEHLSTQHMDSEEKFTCSVCEYRTHYKSNLYRHLLKHTKKTFADQFTVINLDGKKKRKPPKPFKIRPEKAKLKCPHCEYTTKHKHSMVDHANTHEGGPKYSCNICDFATFYRQNFNRHMKKSHDSSISYKSLNL